MYFQNNLLKLDACIACGSPDLVPTLDLGNQPLANSYRTSLSEQQESFPLAINHCKHCFHVQLTHAVNPSLMFKEYLYVSGTSQTMREHFTWFAAYACECYEMLSSLKPSNVLDIGCNDGSQLDAFLLQQRLRTFGVDPAENLQKISGKKHTVWLDYFDTNFVIKHAKRYYDILVAQNVFAHNCNPQEFLRAARMVMDENSLLFIQTSQADMITNNEFDTIYHEHISFFNSKSMKALCERTGMHLIDVIKCPLHGNSYIFVISKNRKLNREANIANVLAMEQKTGLYSEDTYVKYTDACKGVLEDLKYQLQTYRLHDWPIIGYGAAAKGMTLLNAANITPDIMECIIDDNPMKQGRFTPGSDIPIVGSEHLLMYDKPVLFVPLAWNFFDEIKSKIVSKRPEYLDAFLTYFPKVKVQ